MEELTTMAQVGAEIRSIRESLKARDFLDAERRKVDDERATATTKRDEALLARVDGHGERLRTLEINWMTFFSEQGAFTFVRKKLDKMDTRDTWMVCLLIATLVSVIVDMAMKH